MTSSAADSAPTPETPPEHITKDGLTERLELELLSGRPPAGSRLPSERKLADRFGVSRPMIREVLRGLQERGLIEVSPGRGTYVRNFHWSDAVRPLDTIYRRRRPTPRDLVQARMMLERETASLAAEQATDEDLEAIEAALERFDASRDIVARAQADIDFHAAVARASRNPVIETMFGSIRSLAFELMLRSLGDRDVTREGVPYHHEVFAAIRDRDPARAREAMAGHLTLALRTYGNDLDQSLDLVARRQVEQLLDLSGP